MGFLQPKMSGAKRVRYRWFRDIRTTQELRHWDAQYGRIARSPGHLPTSWDDLPRQVERCWKRHRASQFRPKDSGSKEA